MNEPFRVDIETIRRARDRMEEGAVTAAYGADRGRVIEVLNAVLATEIVCALRYKSNACMAAGIHAEPVAEEFREHARNEQEHADRVAERVAIETYAGIVRWLGDGDPTTRRMMEEILAVEEEHADDLANLLERFDERR